MQLHPDSKKIAFLPRINTKNPSSFPLYWWGIRGARSSKEEEVRAPKKWVRHHRNYVIALFVSRKYNLSWRAIASDASKDIRQKMWKTCEGMGVNFFKEWLCEWCFLRPSSGHNLSYYNYHCVLTRGTNGVHGKIFKIAERKEEGGAEGIRERIVRDRR